MTTKVKNLTVLQDALTNLDSEMYGNRKYNTGLVVGIVSAFMSMGDTWEEAFQKVKDNLPIEYENHFPDGWIENSKPAQVENRKEAL